MVSKKTQDDVVSTWSLSSIEADSDANVFSLFFSALFECDDLMALLGKEGVLVL